MENISERLAKALEAQQLINQVRHRLPEAEADHGQRAIGLALFIRQHMDVLRPYLRGIEEATADVDANKFGALQRILSNCFTPFAGTRFTGLFVDISAIVLFNGEIREEPLRAVRVEAARRNIIVCGNGTPDFLEKYAGIAKKAGINWPIFPIQLFRGATVEEAICSKPLCHDLTPRHGITAETLHIVPPNQQ